MQGNESENSTSEKGYYKSEVIANLFGVSVRRIQQLTQDGVISTVQTSQGRRYELAPTIQRYIKYLSDKAYGKSKSETEAKLKEQKLRAEVALKESQGELHRLRTEIAAGSYISVEEVKLDYDRFFISFKKFAMSLPSKLAGRLTGFVDPVEVRQIENELQKETTKLLKSFVVSATIETKQKETESKDAPS
jgi:phage terminase Nu1 subunit (DNA packaging protein)